MRVRRSRATSVVLRLGAHRQFDREAAAFLHFALHSYLSAVGFDDMFHDAQTNADARSFTAQFRAETIEALKNLFVLARWNARPVIGNGQKESGWLTVDGGLRLFARLSVTVTSLSVAECLIALSMRLTSAC